MSDIADCEDIDSFHHSKNTLRIAPNILPLKIKQVFSSNTLVPVHLGYWPAVEVGHVGSPGTQPGIGRLWGADWRLGLAFVTTEETDAAAIPAKATDKARTRMTSFIVGNLKWIQSNGTRISLLLNGNAKSHLNAFFF
jgi:hypothetical protein